MGYPLFFRFLLTVKLVRVRNVLRLTLPNLWEPWKKTLNSFISQQRGNMVEQRECLIDFIFMYYCYIWPSKGFSRCAVFFFQNLVASCACRSRGHWKPHCVVISYSTEFARRSGSQNVWWRRIAHVRIVDGLCEPFFFNSFYLFSDQWGRALQRREDVAWVWDESTNAWDDPEFEEALGRYLPANVWYFRDP